MAFIPVKVSFRTTEADGASVSRGLAGRPQPGDPLFQDGTISASDHMQGIQSSGISSTPVNTGYFGQTSINRIEARHVWLYDSYANALAMGATGLIVTTTDAEGVDRLTGAADGVALVAQTAPTDFHVSEAPGNVFNLDSNGDFVYALDDNSGAGVTYYANTVGGRQNGPVTIKV